MQLFNGKTGLIIGANAEVSHAWFIAKEILAGGGVCGFTHLPDKADDKRQRTRRRTAQLVEPYGDKCKFLVPLDVQSEENIATVMAQAKQEFGQIDFLVHSIAFAPLDDLRKDTVDCSRDGFNLAMEISVYSLLAILSAAKPILSTRSSVLALTNVGGERIMPGYSLMGVCKAALDSCVKYAAYELGPQGVRVNALSVGVIQPGLASWIGPIKPGTIDAEIAPLMRNIKREEIGRVGAFLLSDMSDGITAEIMHVDAGYNAMGSPGRMLERFKDA